MASLIRNQKCSKWHNLYLKKFFCAYHDVRFFLRYYFVCKRINLRYANCQVDRVNIVKWWISLLMLEYLWLTADHVSLQWDTLRNCTLVLDLRAFMVSSMTHSHSNLILFKNHTISQWRSCGMLKFQNIF